MSFLLGYDLMNARLITDRCKVLRIMAHCQVLERRCEISTLASPQAVSEMCLWESAARILFFTRSGPRDDAVSVRKGHTATVSLLEVNVSRWVVMVHRKGVTARVKTWKTATRHCLASYGAKRVDLLAVQNDISFCSLLLHPRSLSLCSNGSVYQCAIQHCSWVEASCSSRAELIPVRP